jgi:predicted double-glycine peptidase
MRAQRTLLVPLALFITQVGCHFGPSRARVTPTKPADSGWLIVPDVPMVTQRERADCGAAALAMVLRFWQPTTANETVRSAVGAVDQQKGIAAGRLREVARDQGLQAFLIQGTFDDLVHEIRRGHPIIVGTLQVSGRRGYPHYEVVVGVHPQKRKILVGDPAEGWREQALDKFEARWGASRRLALVVFAPEGRRNQVAWRDGPVGHDRRSIFWAPGERQRRVDLRPARQPVLGAGRGDLAPAAPAGTAAAPAGL